MLMGDGNNANGERGLDDFSFFETDPESYDE